MAGAVGFASVAQAASRVTIVGNAARLPTQHVRQEHAASGGRWLIDAAVGVGAFASLARDDRAARLFLAVLTAVGLVSEHSASAAGAAALAELYGVDLRHGSARDGR
jgi:hypothetical protein